MRRIKFYTARLKPPFEWNILGARMGAITGLTGLSGFVACLILVNLQLAWPAVAVCGSVATTAWICARWLTAMAPPKPGIRVREGTQLGLLASRLKTPEWSNDHKWPSPIASRTGNVVILKSGEIFINYLIEGVNFTSHRQSSIESCQKLNTLLFSTLARLDFIHEAQVIAMKVRVRPEVIIRRCIDHVPGWQEHEGTLYRKAAEGLSNFHNDYKTGKKKSFERPYWLCIKIGSVDPGRYEQLLDKVGLSPARAAIGLQEAQSRERSVFTALPREFRALRTSPPHLEWALQRAYGRALKVPPLPAAEELRKTMVPGNKNFPLVTITSGHEADSLADLYLAAVAEQAGGSERRLKRIFRDGVLHRYRSLRRETSIAVHQPGTRTTDFPDGLTSYQSLLTLASGPSLEGSVAIHKMSGIIDGFTGLDADASWRVTFTPLPGQKAADKLAKAQRRINADDEALSRSEFDAIEYATQDAELGDLYTHVRSENMIANVSVTFAFADANRKELEHKVARVIDEMDGDGFQLFRHPGAQTELWRAMLPCTTAPPVIDDTRLTSTPALLGSSMPVRRQTLGDPYGWPIGEFIENSLGQVVYVDVLTGGEAGDGSILVFGEKGTGKSMFIKNFGGIVHDLLGDVWAVDPTGEMEVYASCFPGNIIVDLGNPDVSIDVLKCLPPDEATPVWLNIWAPLLGIEPNTAEHERLSTVISPGYRAGHSSPHSTTPGLRTTREVVDHITTSGHIVDQHLRRAFGAIKGLPTAACLLDPVDINTGTVRWLPAFNAEGSRFVVFNSRQYLLRAGDAANDTSSRLATAVFTAIAALAKHYFDRSSNVNLFCLDEAHTLDAPIMRRNILADIDKQGRRFRNMFIVGTQMVDGTVDGLELATRRAAFRQRSPLNAIAALKKVNLTPTPAAVLVMTQELSPARADSHLPEPGREGELFWCDGRNTGKMRTYLPFLAERQRLADTRPSQIIRVDEHRANQRNRHHVG